MERYGAFMLHLEFPIQYKISLKRGKAELYYCNRVALHHYYIMFDINVIDV